MAAAKSTNYVNAFIMASADSDVIVGRVPSKHGTVARGSVFVACRRTLPADQ